MTQIFSSNSKFVLIVILISITYSTEGNSQSFQWDNIQGFSNSNDILTKYPDSDGWNTSIFTSSNYLSFHEDGFVEFFVDATDCFVGITSDKSNLTGEFTDLQHGFYSSENDGLFIIQNGELVAITGYDDPEYLKIIRTGSILQFEVDGEFISSYEILDDSAPQYITGNIYTSEESIAIQSSQSLEAPAIFFYIDDSFASYSLSLSHFNEPLEILAPPVTSYEFDASGFDDSDILSIQKANTNETIDLQFDESYEIINVSFNEGTGAQGDYNRYGYEITPDGSGIIIRSLSPLKVSTASELLSVSPASRVIETGEELNYQPLTENSSLKIFSDIDRSDLIWSSDEFNQFWVIPPSTESGVYFFEIELNGSLCVGQVNVIQL